MNKLYKHLKKLYDSHHPCPYYTITDHTFLAVMGIFWAVGEQYTYNGVVRFSVHHFFRWVKEDLAPYQLQGLFNEHEIMELFMDE